MRETAARSEAPLPADNRSAVNEARRAYWTPPAETTVAEAQHVGRIEFTTKAGPEGFDAPDGGGDSRNGVALTCRSPSPARPRRRRGERGPRVPRIVDELFRRLQVCPELVEASVPGLLARGRHRRRPVVVRPRGQQVARIRAVVEVVGLTDAHALPLRPPLRQPACFHFFEP